MSQIAYLANSFPEASEPYVWEEIRELRKNGRDVVCCSFRRPGQIPVEAAGFQRETLYLFPINWKLALRGSALFATKFYLLLDLMKRIVHGPEPLERKLRCFAHTWLGACLAARHSKQNLRHIHVHHGYFASWTGMVAARLLNAGFSMTLHGSDLLVRADYLDCKLRECRFCVTVSEFHRNYIRKQYPEIVQNKIFVHPLGVDLNFWQLGPRLKTDSAFCILSVGRLHAIKDHAFLVRACKELKNANVNFKCVIAGDGPERQKLRELIEGLNLTSNVELLGHVSREQLPMLYSKADAVVFTSRSEGIPLAAMEAMAMERTVLAPNITGIPELIVDGETGFLYQPGSMPDFVAKINGIRTRKNSLERVQRAARRHVQSNFNRKRNLEKFVANFLSSIDVTDPVREIDHAHPVLQQI